MICFYIWIGSKSILSSLFLSSFYRKSLKFTVETRNEKKPIFLFFTTLLWSLFFIPLLVFIVQMKCWFLQSERNFRKLLWHGSRLTNWYSILSQGLRIAPSEAPVVAFDNHLLEVSYSFYFCFCNHCKSNIFN